MGPPVVPLPFEPAVSNEPSRIGALPWGPSFRLVLSGVKTTHPPGTGWPLKVTFPDTSYSLGPLSPQPRIARSPRGPSRVSTARDRVIIFSLGQPRPKVPTERNPASLECPAQPWGMPGSARATGVADWPDQGQGDWTTSPPLR